MVGATMRGVMRGRVGWTQSTNAHILIKEPDL